MLEATSSDLGGAATPCMDSPADNNPNPTNSEELGLVSAVPMVTECLTDWLQSILRYKCHLKHSWSVPRTPVIKREVGAVSGFSHKLQIPQYFEPVYQDELLLNTDIPGHDIDKLPAASAEHCQALCTDKPCCTYFSYTSLLTGWLQVSHEGVSFQGSDLRFESMDDPDTCQRTCTIDPLCQFYTYFNESYSNSAFRGRCYLKRVITAPAPPKVNKLNNVVSGFSLKSCV
ncbi:plasma kallikrein-like [Hippoglossus hippoglossus]|uniref:plasma kallikrein-like n=1 Tax=Hippoglossus hippoglossus TaxID=8267 RepID=UPI00148C57C5|nr:plasma kallikrein-like [Hippoglossus hippoglossus]